MVQVKQIASLKFIISELKGRYALIHEIYKSAQVKMFAFTGAGFGLLTYLFADPTDRNLFQLPNEQYGKILFLMALFLILCSLYKLFVGIRGVHWEYPLHVVKLKDMEQTSTELKFYEYIRDDYMRACEINQRTYDAVYEKINESSLMLVAGGILVLLIKIFG